MQPLLGLIAVSGLILGVLLILIKLFTKSSTQITVARDGLLADGALPFAKKKYVFSAAERSFYEVLRRLVRNHTVFAKVRLCDLVYVTQRGRGWQKYFNQISRKHLDFIVCDQDLVPVLAIELDDSSHEAEDRRDRDEFVDEVMAAAAFPLLHLRAQRGYVLEELRQQLEPYLSSLREVRKKAEPMPAMDERYAPPKSVRPDLVR